jgi:GH24 family phage-related lysozyme (muramidase)
VIGAAARARALFHPSQLPRRGRHEQPGSDLDAPGRPQRHLVKEDHVTPRFIDWIWHIRGNVALAPGQSSEEAFERLSPLFQEINTSHERTEDTLTFRKKKQAPQDKMSIFDWGILAIELGVDGATLRYHLTSRALLACFLAPFLFLAIGAATVGIGTLEKPPTAEAKKEAEAAEKKLAAVPMNPIDKFLGAPEPEKPDEKKKKEEAEKAKAANGKDKKKEEEEKKGPSPTPAYVFAGIFATLYVGGRILEDWLIKRLFRKRLAGA